MSGLFESDSAPAPSPAHPLGDGDRVLIELYQKAGRTLDDLPYTPEFEALYERLGVAASFPGRDRRAVFHRLHNLRKAGKLPRMGKASQPPPHILPEEEEVLAKLVTERVGTLGQRDQLPFDPRFDDLVQVFSQRCGRELSQRDTWRLIAKLAK